MAFTSQDGRKFTNLSQARAADRKYGAVPVPGTKQGDGRQPVAQSNFPKPAPARKDTAERSSDDSEPRQISDDFSKVAADHGPAQTVSIEHGTDGQHTVTAVMGDGVKHRTTHSSAEDAHGAAGALAGLDSGSALMPGNPAEAML